MNSSRFYLLKESNQFNSVSLSFHRTSMQDDDLSNCQAKLENRKNIAQRNTKIMKFPKL